ncbi:Signal transduction histidine kinase [Cyclobacterium lianum]|uniref:histidine kinase n=1 Tax=Cyclobacterium lianum TaxID=388280 RepID=A0A1M7QK57_9BACT|nr:two-component regulator propeller domain-containing protein [Cyclobacterium lianum]SHN31551.1 Signal transduction histidine kinase [Cyclobacterium lianum]
MSSVLRYLLLISAISLVAFWDLWGQEATGTYRFSHYTSQDGLPQNSVLAIIQDESGYLWLGTDDGLARFDGYQFKTYKHDPEQPYTISNNVIRTLLQDQNGMIWIGTEGGGLNVFHPKIEKFLRLDSFNQELAQVPGKKISSSLMDSKGNIWIGTQTEGIYKISNLDIWSESGRLEAFSRQLDIVHYHRNNSALEDNKIWTIYEDDKGDIWVGTFESGVYKFSGSDIKKPKDSHFPSNRSVKAFFEDAGGNFWIGTEKDGLYKRTSGDSIFLPVRDFEKFSASISQGPNITQIMADQQGKIWIGTLGNGLFMYQPEEDKWQHYKDDPTDPYSLNGNSVYTLFQDQNQNIWLGMYSGEGLNKTNPMLQQFEHIRFHPDENKGLSGKMVKSIMEDSAGNLWVGLFNEGLNLREKGATQFEYFSVASNPGLKNNNVQYVYQSKDGQIWLGTDGGGLHEFSPITRSFTSHTHLNGAAGEFRKNEIWAIAEDADGRLWLGGANGGGLMVFDRSANRFRRIPHVPGDSQTPGFDDIRTLYIDSKEQLWIGTYGGGLNKMDLQTGNFTYYQHDRRDPNSISHDIITCIMEDKKGYFWIGTFGGGLNRLNPVDGTFKVYREKDGLPSDVIKAVLEDELGQLWISTVRGLAVLNRETEVFKNYTQEDGLQSNEFNLGAAFKDADGKLYFGGTNGFNAFYPETIRALPAPNTPVISKLKVLNQEVLPGDTILETQILQQNIGFTDELVLDHQHNSFEFEFSALEYSGQDKLMYAYRLKGYDEDWIVTDSKRRFAPYANLKPGRYQWELKVFREESAEQSAVRTLGITMLPPWYRSQWAYLCYALLFILLVYLSKRIISWRIKLRNDLKFERLEKQKQKEISRLKMRFFTNISHELRTPLMLIKAPLERLSKAAELSDSTRHQLISIHNNAQRLLKLINQLLDFRKQETGHLQLAVKQVNVKDFLQNIFQSFEAMAIQNSIHFSLEVDEKLAADQWFDPDQMEKVFYNIIFNAFKFTPQGGKITVRLLPCMMVSEEERFPGFKIEVEDNGPGIEPEFQPLIFDRFYQINEAHSFGKVGTGIGLALSKNLVNFHKGIIEVHSEPHVRTIFSVKLRTGYDHYQEHEMTHQRYSASATAAKEGDMIVISDHRASKATKSIPRHPQSDKKVLVVEDNPELLELLREALAERFTVNTATNGREGLEIINRYRPDLVLSDVMMPEMDGIEFCARIKNDINSSHIPVLLLTAKSSHMHQLEGYESGADDYITKPFPLDLLLVKINNLLEGRFRFQTQFKRTLDLSPEKVQISSPDEKILKTAIAVIEKHMDEPSFGIPHLVKELGLSRTLVFEKFRSLLDQTPNEFIQMIRLKRAAHLLVTSDLKISEIAYMVGFNRPKYFSQCFQKQFTNSPKVYRQKQQAGLHNEDKAGSY